MKHDGNIVLNLSGKSCFTFKRNGKKKKKKGFFLSMVGIPIAGAATAISLMRPRWNLRETEQSVSS